MATLKYSRQRESIKEFLTGRTDHPTADFVYENMKQMCFTAFDNGITHFDLANNYGPQPGSAEKNFGKILREEFSAYRDELIVSTKAGYDCGRDLMETGEAVSI